MVLLSNHSSKVVEIPQTSVRHTLVDTEVSKKQQNVILLGSKPVLHLHKNPAPQLQ